MSGPKGSERYAASGSRASACFLCRREMRTLAGTGTTFNVNGCEGLSEFLIGEGFLALPSLLPAEEMCRVCVADLWKLEDLLNQEKEIRKEMIQTAKLIKSRVQQLEPAAADCDQDKDSKGNGPATATTTDSEDESLFELLSIHSEDDENDADGHESEEEEQGSSSSEEDEDRSAAKARPAMETGNRGRPSGGPYPCEVSGCRAILDKKYALYKHFLQAHNHRPFRCREPSCNAAFSYPAHLKGHMASTHENKGRRPFRCGVAGCGKRFSSLIYLQGHHYKVHSGKTVRTCGICGKKLATSYTLKVHIMRVHARKKN